MQKSLEVKFVFVSNYLNHHQIPFCDAMYDILDGSFVFVQTEPVEQERIRMGWRSENDKPYLRLWEEDPKGCEDLILQSGLVMFGGSDDESLIQPRLQNGSPVIRCSERLYKTGQWKAVSPRGLRKKYYDHTRYRKNPVYLLCAGAYVPSDFHIVRAYPKKMLKWGYFPETRLYDVDKLMQEKKPATLLWAARMIDWKHPELPLKTARYLKEKGCSFHLDMVGGGDMEETVKQFISEYNLENVVTLRGYCAPEQVRELMERADIYLATSDREEGWGAVVNEAMNSGCAVVASHMMGAVPYLITHEKNGMIYKDGADEMLFRMAERLVNDRELCAQLGRSAINTIVNEWNAEKAAMRLVQFCVRKGFLQQADLAVKLPIEENDFPKTGPCSEAEVISERKMYRLLRER